MWNLILHCKLYNQDKNQAKMRNCTNCGIEKEDGEFRHFKNGRVTKHCLKCLEAHRRNKHKQEEQQNENDSQNDNKKQNKAYFWNKYKQAIPNPQNRTVSWKSSRAEIEAAYLKLTQPHQDINDQLNFEMEVDSTDSEDLMIWDIQVPKLTCFEIMDILTVQDVLEELIEEVVKEAMSETSWVDMLSQECDFDKPLPMPKEFREPEVTNVLKIDPPPNYKPETQKTVFVLSKEYLEFRKKQVESLKRE